MGKIKNQNAKPAPTIVVSPTIAAPPPRVAPLFRPVDWLALGVTATVVFIVFFMTLAPDVTLEDSGEMSTASFWGGIPHAPGYPVWTMYTWLWARLPFGSVAWRVELGNAFAGAIAAGLLALVVSRSSSMFIESVDAFKNISRRWENAICFVAGFVAGGLSDFNGFMWSQTVIVDKHTLSITSLLAVVVFLLRWVYAPHQHRYLYAAFFMYGICVNNHQSLLPIIMGMQVLMWLAEPKLGREFFFGNTVIFLVCEFLVKPGVLIHNSTVLRVYNVIGITSALLWIWLVIKTRKTAIEFGRDAAMLALLGCLGLLFLGVTDYLPAFNSGRRLFLVLLVTVPAGWLFVRLVKKTSHLSKEWFIVLVCGLAWLLGAAFYLYEPIVCMTDPPMEWAYPRTVDGFIHAITRGQYSPINPTSGFGNNVFEKVGDFFSTYGLQLWRYLEGIAIQFNLFFLLLPVVIFLVYRQLKRRERVWLIGMATTYICTGPFLVLLLNFAPDRESIGISAPLFALGHVFIAMFVAYGLTLICAYLATQYEAQRKWLLLGGLCGLDFALFTVAANCQTLIGNLADEIVSRYGFLKMACWILATLAIVIIRKKRWQDERLLSYGLPGFFVLVSFGLTIATIFQGSFAGLFRNLGQAFQPNQYGLPIYAGLIFLGMALIFLCSLWTLRQKAPLGIILAIFTAIPGYSALIHWSHSEQRNHWFGYWFGHDMFTPPFTAPDGRLSYDPKSRAQAMKGPNGRLVYPEMTRNAILFGGTDPGRFCPTYMIFCESFVPPSCKPLDPNFDRRDVYIITQNALADPTYLQYIRAQYFRSAEIDPPFFRDLLRGPAERKDNYETNILARLAYTILDQPLTAWGLRVENRRRAEGVYPPKEIYTPTPDDSQRCFNEYCADASRRYTHDEQFPNEPKQMRPGESVVPVPQPDGTVKLSISGNVSVMAINGLLTKVIFDHNATNEFFVEESFPLDWMYEHLTPFGIIMKINRQPVPELTEEMVKRDHEFWSQYSARLIGNWITYDTPVKDIVQWVEKVYLHRDLSGFTGDRKFIRDDQGQKAFSKLRSSIAASIYNWRITDAASNRNPAVRERMIKEADFAYRQAFAFCPYSPEVLYHYANLLMMTGRADDALLIARTALKFDPYNTSFISLTKQLETAKNAPNMLAQLQTEIGQLENAVRANPTDFPKAFELAQKYGQLGRTDQTIQVLDQILGNPRVQVNDVITIARAYAQLNNASRLEAALEKLVKLAPNQAEFWYELAGTEAVMGKAPDALQNLRHSVELNAQQLALNPKEMDLRSLATNDPRFTTLRGLPEFQTILRPPH